MNHEATKAEYAVRLKALVWSRVLLTTFLVATLFFFRRHYHVFTFKPSYLFIFLGTVYLLTILYLALLRRARGLEPLAYLQASLDIMLVTGLVSLTGGIDSAFSLLYHLVIISASIILSRRGGLLSASLASILYGTMLDMQFYGFLGFPRSQNFTAMQVLYQVFISILSFYLVALLSGYLAERLRRTRQELREKSIDFNDLRALQDNILRSVGSGILTMDLNGTIASWNPAAESITGYDHNEIKTRWKDVFSESIKGIFGHTDMMKERPYRFNSRLVKKNKETAILGMTASLLKDDTNTIRGIILIFQDITKMVEMEEQVRQQERLATVGSLAAGIAHEIRNPLASLSGSIQLLQSELDLKGDNKHLMNIVVKETNRLNTIITEFLDYARPRSTRENRIDITATLEETLQLLKNSSDFSDQVSIRREFCPGMTVHGDAQRMRQVFWNLLINAFQAMPRGGVLTIRTAIRPHEDMTVPWCEVQIEDTGPGIARDDLRKIFDPFFTTKTGGTGLGLAIAYRIIEDHKGTITVESEPGRGTCFMITMPMEAE